MELLDQHQFAILQGVRTGRYLGAAPLADLQSDVDLMLKLRIIEPTGACPYRLTPAGAQILALAEQSRPPAQRR